MPSFSVLSLNTFGIPMFLSAWRLKRLTWELNRLAPSVICLQEIQQNAYIPLLQRNLPAHPHTAFSQYRMAPKGGLFTASVLECLIISSEFHPFPNRGRLLSIGFSDWWLLKGALVVHLDIQGHRVIVINTHLQANYLSNWQPTNLQTKIQLDQAASLAELARSQPEDAWVFVCGDFNFPRISPAYEVMVSQSGFTDPLANDLRPTYNPFRLPLIASKWHITLDYFFYRMPQGENGDVSADILPIVDTNARWSFQRFLTDHYALVVNIR